MTRPEGLCFNPLRDDITTFEGPKESLVDIFKNMVKSRHITSTVQPLFVIHATADGAGSHTGKGTFFQNSFKYFTCSLSEAHGVVPLVLLWNRLMVKTRVQPKKQHTGVPSAGECYPEALSPKPECRTAAASL